SPASLPSTKRGHEQILPRRRTIRACVHQSRGDRHDLRSAVATRSAAARHELHIRVVQCSTDSDRTERIDRKGKETFMRKLIALLYGIVDYLAFAATIVYAIGFVSGIGVPKTIDSGLAGDPMQSIIINVLLMSLFAIQRSVMARPQFKKWWTRFVPERSTFVLSSSLALMLLL